MIYAVNEAIDNNFKASNSSAEHKYSCSIKGGRYWSDCSVKKFNSSTTPQFDKELDDLKTTNDVFEIKISKDIGLDWQTSSLKITPKSVPGDTNLTEGNLKILFSTSDNKATGKTKYFIGKSVNDQSSIANIRSCTINKINYTQCKIYNIDIDPQTSEKYQFKKLNSSLVNITSTAKNHKYLIEVTDKGIRKTQDNIKEIDFIFTLSTTGAQNNTNTEPSTFTEIKFAKYHEASKFLTFEGTKIST